MAQGGSAQTSTLIALHVDRDVHLPPPWRLAQFAAPTQD